MQLAPLPHRLPVGGPQLHLVWHPQGSARTTLSLRWFFYLAALSNVHLALLSFNEGFLSSWYITWFWRTRTASPGPLYSPSQRLSGHAVSGEPSKKVHDGNWPILDQGSPRLWELLGVGESHLPQWLRTGSDSRGGIVTGTHVRSPPWAGVMLWGAPGCLSASSLHCLVGNAPRVHFPFLPFFPQRAVLKNYLKIII